MRQERHGQGQPFIPAGIRALLPRPGTAAVLRPSDQAQPRPAAPRPHPCSCGCRTGIAEAAGCLHGLPRVPAAADAVGGCRTKGTRLPACCSLDTSCPSTLGNMLLLYF